MKKMLKRTLSLMLALLMVAGLAACGNNADQQPSNPPRGELSARGEHPRRRR